MLELEIWIFVELLMLLQVGVSVCLGLETVVLKVIVTINKYITSQWSHWMLWKSLGLIQCILRLKINPFVGSWTQMSVMTILMSSGVCHHNCWFFCWKKRHKLEKKNSSHPLFLKCKFSFAGIFEGNRFKSQIGHFLSRKWCSLTKFFIYKNSAWKFSVTCRLAYCKGKQSKWNFRCYSHNLSYQ